jgi:hypothetical protein
VMIDLGVPLTGISRCDSRGAIGAYLGLDVVERRWADYGEADQEDVGLWVRKRSQPIVVFLTSCIPQSKANGLAIYHYIRRVVVEAGRLAGTLRRRLVPTHTVGIYSPGKAFVVYEMSRHVCTVSNPGRAMREAAAHLANGAIARDNALFTVSKI